METEIPVQIGTLALEPIVRIIRQIFAPKPVVGKVFYELFVKRF
jgi:hypothetical protein